MTLLDDYRRAVYSRSNDRSDTRQHHHRLMPLMGTERGHHASSEIDSTAVIKRVGVSRSKHRAKPQRPTRLDSLPSTSSIKSEDPSTPTLEGSQRVGKTHIPSQSNQHEPSTPSIFDRLAALSAAAEREGSTHAIRTPTELPSEYIYHSGAHLLLNRWSVIVSDVTLHRIAAHNRRLHTTLHRHLITPPTPTLSSPTPTPTNATRSLHINGAERITDVGLRAIADNIPTLESLEIAHATQITDAGLRCLAANCRRLARLNLSNCTGVRGAGLAAIAEHCTSVTDLQLADCPQLHEWVLRRCFYAFALALRHANFSRCPQLSDHLLHALASQCRFLESLQLIDCVGVTDVGVVAIAQWCPHLAKLVLSRSTAGDKLTDTSCAALGEHCPQLRELHVAGCGFLTDAGVQWLARGCPQLEIVDVSHVIHLTDAAMRALGSGCPRLESIKLCGVKNVSDVGLRFLATGCPGLKRVHLTSLYLVSDGHDRDFGLEGLQAIAQHGGGQLRELVLTGCFQVVERSLMALGTHCGQLTRVSLKGCPQVTLAGVAALLCGCPQLEALNLAGATQCSNAMLAAIAVHGKKLKTLNVAQCDKVGDAGLRHLAQSGRADQWESLDLSGCALVTDAGVCAIVDALRTPRLAHLWLAGCAKVTQDAIARLAFVCPLLLTLSLQGCRVSPRVLQSLSACWPLAELRTPSTPSTGFYGLWPVARAKDKRFIEESCVLWAAAVRVQSLFRRRIARRATQRQYEHNRMVFVARRLQSVWRGRQARREALLLKLFKSGLDKAATKIQRRYRELKARRRMATQLQTLHDAQLDKYVVLVQRRYRAVRSARLVRATLGVRRWQRQKEIEAAVLLQRRYRGLVARRRVNLLQLHRRTKEKEEREASLRIQGVYRGRVDRTKAREAEAQKRQFILRQYAMATKLQALWRRRLARSEAQRLREARAYREQCAVRLQTAFRARKGRETMDLLRLAKHHATWNAAAVLLQRHWRGRRDRVAFAVLQEAKRLRGERQQAAVVLLQRTYRRYLIRRKARDVMLELLRAKRHDEEMERWAATMVQANWRRRGALKELHRVQQEKRSRWKQLVDAYNQHGMGFGAPFFYNQVNGEIRWRMPREVLTLQPHPSCDQCATVSSASVECATCGEFFCDVCHAVVHGAGKRRTHTTRRLFNFYGIRCDVGDGEFPSVWPSEQLQDRQRGYDFITQTPKANYQEMLWQIAQFQPVETDPGALKKKALRGHDDPGTGPQVDDTEPNGMTEPYESVVADASTTVAVLFLEDDVAANGESLWARFFDYGCHEYRYFHRISKRVTSQPPPGGVYPP